MSIFIRLRASVVSYKGILNINNQNGFYLDGKFTGKYHKDNMEVSVEGDSEEHIFSVYSGIGIRRSDSDKDFSAYVADELAKLQDSIKGSRYNIEGRLDQLNRMVEELDNLIYSSMLKNAQLKNEEMGFSGVVMYEGMAGILNAGNCCAYLLREESIKKLGTSLPRIEKLSSPDNGDSKNGGQIYAEGEIRPGNRLGAIKSEIIELAEGDVLLLCNRGLADAMQEQAIREILMRNHDTSGAAGELANEAQNRETKGDIIALVIRIDEISEQHEMQEEGDQISRWSDRLINIYDKKQEIIRTFIAAALTCIILAAVIITTYEILNSAADIENPAANQIMSNKTTAPKSTSMTQQTAQTSTNQQSTGMPKTSETAAKTAAASTGVNAPSSTVSGTSAGDITYVVQKGDSLSSIAKKFYKDSTKTKPIMERNNITDPNKIREGQVLIIP